MATKPAVASLISPFTKNIVLALVLFAHDSGASGWSIEQLIEV